MGKIKKQKSGSLKWKLMLYIPICAILAYLGTYIIGMGSNELQDWYQQKYIGIDFHPHEGAHEVLFNKDGSISYYIYEVYEDGSATTDHLYKRVVYWLISYAQVILIPAWVLLCVALTGILFYRRELEQPITTLLDASEKISENCLDFHVKSDKKNELGVLCRSFEEMRAALYQNNQEMWRMLEERKRLNAAFSHDMRTPITVLKGYTDLLENYVPGGKISQEKLLEILGLMSGQIARLEKYTQKMSALQKLEDIVPERKLVTWSRLLEQCGEIEKALIDKLQVTHIDKCSIEGLSLDEELVFEVYENLLSNAVRYAKSRLEIEIYAAGNKLRITIQDDGTGFTPEALRRAADPFYRDDKEKENVHFGLGLYICRVLCEKCGGELIVENGESGGKVTAVFELPVQEM